MKLARTALAATTAPTAALCIADPAETPVMRAYREWWDFDQYVKNHETSGIPDSEFNPLCDRRVVMERMLIDLPSGNAQDALAKLLIYISCGIDDLPAEPRLDEIMVEARASRGGSMTSNWAPDVLERKGARKMMRAILSCWPSTS